MLDYSTLIYPKNLAKLKEISFEKNIFLSRIIESYFDIILNNECFKDFMVDNYNNYHIYNHIENINNYLSIITNSNFFINTIIPSKFLELYFINDNDITEYCLSFYLKTSISNYIKISCDIFDYTHNKEYTIDTIFDYKNNKLYSYEYMNNSKILYSILMDYYDNNKISKHFLSYIYYLLYSYSFLEKLIINQCKIEIYDFHKIFFQSKPINIVIPYTIKKGDTLSSIAEKYYNDSLKWNIIYKFNKNYIKNPNIIYEKNIIYIPNENIFNKDKNYD